MEMCDAIRAGTPKKVAELDYGKHLVGKYAMHLPEGTAGARRRDLVRVSIVERAERAESVDAIASLENCSIRFVVGILRAWAFERDARARLDRGDETEKPRRRKRGRRPARRALLREPPPGSLLAKIAPPTRAARIRAAYREANRTVEEIAREHGVSVDTVERATKGIPRRKGGRRTDRARVESIRANYLAGVPVEQIAREHGVGAGTVQYHVRDLPRRSTRRQGAAPTLEEHVYPTSLSP